MAFIGKLVWNALGWAMPGLSAASFYLAAGAMVFGLTAAVAYFKGVDGKGAAIASEKAACNLRIADQRTAAAESLAHLLGTINALPGEEPKTDAEEAEMCKRSKLCRGAK